MTESNCSVNTPFFSICIPTYNASEYIEDCVLSVASQSFDGWEIVICDDCSTDSTMGHITEISRWPQVVDRLKITRMPMNSGPFLSRRKAIENADGKFIICLDADDELIGTDFLRQLHEIILSTNCDMIMFNMSDSRRGGKRIIDYSMLKSADDDSRSVALNDLIAGFSSGYQFNNLASKAIKKELFASDSYPFAEGLRMCEDRLEMIGILRRVRKVSLFDEIGYYYRPNDTSTTNSSFCIEYCVQQDAVENEVHEMLLSCNHLRALLPNLEFNTLSVIADDMNRLAYGKSTRVIADEYEQLCALPWFAHCVNAARTHDLKINVELRIKLLKNDRFIFAALLCRLHNLLKKLNEVKRNASKKDV